MIDEDALKKWVEDNPLRKFKLKNRITNRRMAATLNCAVVSITMWERGLTQPRRESFATIAKAMVLSPTKLEQAWASWMGRKPREKAA